MPNLRIFLILVVALVLPSCRRSAPEKFESNEVSQQTVQTPKKEALFAESDQIASLIDPRKLATLKDRGANPRICKIMAILYTAKCAGKSPEEIVVGSIEKIGWGGTDKGRLTGDAMIRNLRILEELGSITPEDIAQLRKGRSPTVRQGPYAGDILSVDHIIPRAAVPELDNVIANLELMPLKLNRSKSDKIGDRQRALAKMLYSSGLLSDPKRVR